MHLELIKKYIFANDLDRLSYNAKWRGWVECMYCLMSARDIYSVGYWRWRARFASQASQSIANIRMPFLKAGRYWERDESMSERFSIACIHGQRWVSFAEQLGTFLSLQLSRVIKSTIELHVKILKIFRRLNVYMLKIINLFNALYHEFYTYTTYSHS